MCRLSGCVGDGNIREVVLSNGSDCESIWYTTRSTSVVDDGEVSQSHDIQTLIAKANIAVPVTIFRTR